MSDDNSAISGCVKDTYAANEQAAISTIGSFGNATKQVPAVVYVVPSTNTSATASELVTATTFSNVQPDPEDKARDMSAAPIMGTTSVVLHDFVSPGSPGCRSTTTADCMDTTRLQQPLLEHKDYV